MKEKQRKIMGLIISFVMIITIMPQTIWASDAGTREDAVKWAYAQEGKFLDYDKVYGAQCVDLVHYYYAYFGKTSYATGNGCDFVNNKLPDGWTRIKNTPDFVPQPGDIAVWGKELSQYGHVAIILSADAHSFVSMDQNWPRGSACKKVTHNYNKFWGVIRPNFSEPPSDPPTYSNFWIDSNFYDLSETITFNVTASGADRFAIGIDKIGGARVITEGCGSTYSISANRLGTGSYSAYMSVANSAGYVDTYRVEFTVVEKMTIPTYSNFWIDGNFYDLSGTITFNVTASMADRFAIGIDKIGVGRVVTEGCGSTYSISAERLGTGNYSAYMSVANSAGGVDTYRVEFTIVEKMTIPTYSNFWVDRNLYDLSDTIIFNVTASMADRFAIGIDKIGGARVVTEGCGSTYSISAERLGTGNYSAYMSVANSAGGVDTYRVGFIVAEKSKYLDIGTNFIANIIRTDSWSHVVNNNANACIGQEVGNANEYWYFQKQDDGSYTIRSMEDGKYLDVTEAGNSDGLNVYCNDYTGADNQRWFIKQGTNGLILIPKCAINSCLDIANGFTAVGTNAWLWTQNGTAAQEFNVYKEDTIKLGTANVTLSNNNYIYDGKEKKPDVTVKYGYATLQ